MSTLRNQVQLIGRLGADAEIKTTTQGHSFAQLRFATNEYIKNAAGEWRENTQWHTLVLWGDLTKVLEMHGTKGSQLLVQGALQYREYTDSQEIRRTVAEIKVQKIMPFQNHPKSTEVAKSEDDQESDLPF